MKKAQTEIIGLAIIVILIIVGITFAIRFMATKEPVEYKKEFTQTELATNMLNTFLETTSDDCNGLSMTELLQACGQGSSISCDGKTSCTYAKDEAKKIFDRTLKIWNINYEFKAFYSEDNPKIVLGEACTGNKKSKLFPIPTAASGTLSTLSVKLDICG